jgi:flavin reductase (DIM6/NTAB) family NADH-FMN oxidoreductase RutF
MSVDPETMRKTLRLWSCGVTVVTSKHGEERSGMTASSFTSIALEPPLILVCLYKDTLTSRLILASQQFAVSILGESQEAASAQFAGFAELPEGEDRFYQMDTFTGQSGILLLSDAIAWLECNVYATYDGGTHHIFVGEVTAADRKDDPVLPLVYHNRGYRPLIMDSSDLG